MQRCSHNGSHQPKVCGCRCSQFGSLATCRLETFRFELALQVLGLFRSNLCISNIRQSLNQPSPWPVIAPNSNLRVGFSGKREMSVRSSCVRAHQSQPQHSMHIGQVSRLGLHQVVQTARECGIEEFILPLPTLPSFESKQLQRLHKSLPLLRLSFPPNVFRLSAGEPFGLFHGQLQRQFLRLGLRCSSARIRRCLK